MIRIARGLVLFFLITSFFVKNATAADIKKADLLFDKGTFQEALKEYEAVFKEASDEQARFKAFFRINESLAHLYRYAEAAQRILETPAPSQMPQKVYFLILKAELFRNFLLQYSNIQSQDVIDEQKSDVLRLTPVEIKKEIKSTYEALWELKDVLLVMDVKKEEYYLNLDRVDFGMYPTMFDYLIYAWTGYLMNDENRYNIEKGKSVSADDILVEDFKKAVNLTDPNNLLVPELMEEAYRTSKGIRQEAGERWRIKRLLLPFNYGNYIVKDYTVQRNQAKKILLDWMERFKTNEGKAQAGYEAALIYNGNNELVEAVKLCLKIEKNFSATIAGHLAELLRKQIEMPYLEIRAKASVPPATQAFTINSRNLKKVYFRAYKIDPDKLKEDYLSLFSKEHRYSSRIFDGWSALFNSNWLNTDYRRKWVKDFISFRPADKKWVSDTGDKGDYQYISKELTTPDLETGIYLVIASQNDSFAIGSVMTSACFLNVTDLAIIGTAGFTTKTENAYYEFIKERSDKKINDSVFRVYSLNAASGKPVGKTSLNILKYDNEDYEAKERKTMLDLFTGEDGFLEIPVLVDVNPQGYNNYYYIDLLAKKESSYSYWQDNLSFSDSLPNPLSVFVNTDRAIYRPGNNVNVKVVGVMSNPAGFNSFSDQSARIEAYDPNGKVFFDTNLKLNEFGSASTTFQIPTGRILGNYYINATVSGDYFSQNQRTNFSVEEYKRPEFEIILNKEDGAWKYNQPVEIKGEAKYYFGGVVPDAPVKYRIKRQPFIPWCYRYWFADSSSYSYGQEIATGDVKTDKDGKFSIPFTPVAGNAQGVNVPDISQFTVEVEARDAGGRTIQANEIYKAGKNSVYFSIEPKKGFFLEREKIEILSKSLTINDTPAEGKSTYEVYSLGKLPKQDKQLELNNHSSFRRRYRGVNWIPPIDAQLKDAPNDRLMAKGEVEHDKEGKANIIIPELAQGAYRIIEKTTDYWGAEVEQNKIFVVAKNTLSAVPIEAYSVMLAEKSEYAVGDTAKFLIGSCKGSGTHYLELWAGPYFLSKQIIDSNNPVQLVEIPVIERMKGGFTIRWFTVKDFEIYGDQITVGVPWVEKKLSLNLEPFIKELKPGIEATWGIKVEDNKGNPVSAEVLAFMYDRSLEYYRAQNISWLDSLYNLRSANTSENNSVFDPYFTQFQITEGLLKQILDSFRQPKELGPPQIRAWRTWVGGRGGFFRFGSKGILSESVDYMEDEYASKLEVGESRDGVPRMAKQVKDKELKQAATPFEEQAATVKTRNEFADTAFFYPHLITTDKDGQIKFNFVAPEQLTSWRIKAFAFTKDIKEGALKEEAVTRKDLMVRLDLPRFFREKDKGTITAIVHNESKEALTGDLLVEITENGQSINEKVKLADNKKSFEVASKSLVSFNWMIDIPEGVTNYKVRAVAIASKLTDAEERDLPIFPSRERLIESKLVSLSGSENKKLDISLKEDPTRINESMVLQIDPQLALSILNSIPFLIDYPHECVEQMLNKFVPLAIVNEMYKTYPSLQKAVAKIPKRDTVTPAWEENDPRRLMTLMETPWVWESEGRPTTFPTIDLLNPQIVEKQKESVFSRLQSAQLSNGAFPWWPGGEADAYMTLYVLAGLSEARRYNVEVPSDMINRALSYVNREIPLRLKPEERDLALISYAAYVVTSFSKKEFSEATRGFEAARAWVVYLEKEIYALTPLAKAYLAFTYYRLGDIKRANEVLDMAMDGVREDPIAGVYWTPEKYSWVWYSDTVEKHAFLLKTLQELRPDDKKIPGMVQWLLFNRKGNVWKSTKASAAAVYALLDNLNKRGALDSDETYKVNWGKDNYSIVVKAEDWLDEPIRYQKKGFEITNNDMTPEITKEGPGIAFASLTWTYSTDQIPEASSPGMLELDRKFYKRVKEDEEYHLKLLSSGDEVSVGDQIEVQLKVNTKSQFEYMHLKDPKAAGFEAETLLSGWKYDKLTFYEEPRDSLTNFFISWLPHGEYIMIYRLRPTKPGVYKIGAATLQSMYSPDMTAHSGGFIVKVVDDKQQ